MLLDFQQKNKIRNIIYSRITLVILFLVLCFITYSTFVVYRKMDLSSKQKEKISEDILTLEQKNKDLEFQIKSLETKAGLEREIRDRFAVAKEGEKVVLIVEDQVSSTTIPVKNSNFWTKIKIFLGLQSDTSF